MPWLLRTSDEQLVACPKNVSCKSFDHKMDQGDVDEGRVTFGGSFVRPGEQSGSIQPSECAFYNSAFRVDVESGRRSLHNFDDSQPLHEDPQKNRRIRLIGEDDSRKLHQRTEYGQRGPAC